MSMFLVFLLSQFVPDSSGSVVDCNMYLDIPSRGGEACPNLEDIEPNEGSGNVGLSVVLILLSVVLQVV